MDNIFVQKILFISAVIKSKLCALHEKLPEWMRERSLLKLLPQTLLLCYYPLLCLEDLVEQSLHLTLKYHDSGLFLAVALLSIGPLLYLIFSKHLLLDHILFRRSQPGDPTTEQPYRASEDLEKREPDALSEFDLRTNLRSGLITDEVRARKKHFGRNEIGSSRNWFSYLWQFSVDPAHLLIEAVTLLAIVFKQWLHIAALLLLIALSASSMLAPQKNADDVVQSISWDPRKLVVVLRNGKITEVTTSDLVPGDVVHVSEGSLVPADGKIVSVDGTLEVDESSITGEHNPVLKYESGICYATSIVLRNDAFLTIQSTGKDTFVGRIASMVQSASHTNPQKPQHVVEYEMVLRFIGKIMIGILSATTLYVIMHRHSGDCFFKSLKLIVALAIVTVSFQSTSAISSCRAIGAAALAKRTGCVAQKIDAIDALAGIDVLCSDKTGTITENRLTVAEPFCLSCDPDDLMLVAGLSCQNSTNPDPIDRAILKALKHFPQAKAAADRHRILDTETFNAETKTMRCLVETPSGDHILCLKGAPKAVLNLCFPNGHNNSNLPEVYRNAVTDLAHRGFRTLGVARQRVGEEWELLGAIPMHDPPRFDTSSTIDLAKNMGVDVKITTGDAMVIITKLAKHIGIGTIVLHAKQIDEFEVKNSASLRADIERSDVYAEIFCEHKEKIVRVLQSCGHRVAITGDGVADREGLSIADCGLAVDGATETAQNAADMVFVEPGLKRLVQSIQISRQIFQQTQNHMALQCLRTIHILLVTLWSFVMYQDVLPLRLLLSSTNLTSLVTIFLPTSYANTPYSRYPVRWNRKRLMIEVTPLVVVLTSITILDDWMRQSQHRTLSALKLPSPQGDVQSIKPQTLPLFLILTNYWISLIMHTDGRFWAYYQNYRLASVMLCMHLVTTTACILGLAGQEYHIDLSTAVRIWLVSLGSFGLAAAARYAFSDGSLIDRPLDTEDKRP